jgi:hypothetical protein
MIIEIDRCNGEVWCSLCGTDCILKYYLDELRLQRVKSRNWDENWQNFTALLGGGGIKAQRCSERSAY